ncbi:MAG: HAMP domain-containing histidine kinase [Candidatus Thiodiazotropha sp. (ex Dulcina madagascariensis)]|nr:HAMP domain-containing histidine kinase [Candidatus Thiodiazotropha sp. (ex Dulcina madagascariensis)]
MMQPTRTPRSLYQRLLISHLQIAAISAMLLCICAFMIAYFQHRLATIADVRLPAAMASSRIVNGIDASNSHLRSWVLLGDPQRIEARNIAWSEQIEPAIAELETHSKSVELPELVTLKRKMEQLKEAQWWVEDIATTEGNNPARMIYERELLPVYHKIQSAVIGLDWNSSAVSDVSDIQLATALTHQSLSEAVRQLSEAVRTGNIAEISEFREGSDSVLGMLNRLSDRIGQNVDTRRLLDWILREYQVYEDLADETIKTRRSNDWNRALFILRSEVEPLSVEAKGSIIALQSRHNELLRNDIARSELISRAGAFLTFAMIIGLGILAWAIARERSQRIAAPIKALANASEKLAANGERAVKLHVSGPSEIAHLTERFNFMSRELTARTQDLWRANQELQEYTHIITHDLKPPLINIKGHAGLISSQIKELEAIADQDNVLASQLRAAIRRCVRETIPESVRFIDISIAKTNVLIGGVLNHSKALFRSITIEEVDIRQLVDQVLIVFNHRAQGVEFEIDKLPVIQTDTFIIEHVFSNLIDNAIKYLDPKRAGRITIDSGSVNGEIRFYISDNGIGIPDTDIDIFKLFKRVDHDNEGAGVGLALVKTLLARIGGEIWYQRNNDFGTTFVFSLPAVVS